MVTLTLGKIQTHVCSYSLLLFLIGCTTPPSTDAPKLPDHAITPGDVLTSSPEIICVHGYSKSVRNVPKRVKEQVYRSYGILTYDPGDFEVDHLVSLELGGSNSVKNLWPESYLTEPYNAHKKDVLENKLHSLVCSGDLPLTEAQAAISQNWITAYEKYVNHSMTKTKMISPNQSKDQKKRSVIESKPKSDSECPPKFPVKVSKTGIYHLIDEPNYGKTKAKKCFRNPEAAEAAGYRAPYH